MNNDWTRWPNFFEYEFQCRGENCCGGRADMDPKFMDKLQEVRNIVGFSMQINSGFRCPQHPSEVSKDTPGAHTYGVAADVACDGRQAYYLNQAAVQVGMTGIGFSQRSGRGRFIHMDTYKHLARPNIWSY